MVGHNLSQGVCYLLIQLRDILLPLSVLGSVNYHFIGVDQAPGQCSNLEFSGIDRARSYMYVFQIFDQFFRISHLFRGEVQNHQRWQPGHMFPHTFHPPPHCLRAGSQVAFLTNCLTIRRKRNTFCRPSNRSMLVSHTHSKYSKAAAINPQGKKKGIPFWISLIN